MKTEEQILNEFFPYDGRMAFPTNTEPIGKQILKYNSKVPFGKYKGMTFEQLFEEDLGYLTWFRDNVSTHILDDEIKQDIDKFNEIESLKRDKYKLNNMLGYDN